MSDFDQPLATDIPPVSAEPHQLREIEFLSPVKPEVRPPSMEPQQSLPPGFLLSKLIWLMFGLALLFVAWYIGPRIVEEYQYALTRGRQRAEYETATTALKNRPLSELSLAFQMVSQRVGPSVVHISTSSKIVQVEPADEQSPFFGAPNRLTQGQGSGVIVEADGYLVTNAHVIVVGYTEDDLPLYADEIYVTLSDNRQLKAQVVGSDKATDMAVLKIKAGKLIPAEWGDSDELKVGSLVWAVGSPYGLDQSITAGILSAKHRDTGTVYQDFLQSDAAVNPGNSGGPLVDDAGRVVGINSQIVGPTYQGISFAIPSSIAEKVYRKIKLNGDVKRGWIGAAPTPVTAALAEKLNLTDAKGAYIERVVDNAPAQRAGIRAGDVVVRWDGQAIDSPSALFSAVGFTEAGNDVEVVLIRDGAEIKLQVTVEERPKK